jgi:hypothetical protein
MTRRGLAPAAFLAGLLAVLVVRPFGLSDGRSSDLRPTRPHAGALVHNSGVEAPATLRTNHGTQVSATRQRTPGPRLPGALGVTATTVPLAVAMILLAALPPLLRRRSRIARAPSRSPPALLFA